jgi:hypothetical protein
LSVHVRGALLGALVALSKLSAARPTSPDAAALSAAAQIVTIEVKAEPEAVSRLRSTAVPLLHRLGVTAVVTGQSSGPDEVPRPLARAYINLENPKLPRLVVVDGVTRRELARRTLAQTTSLETSIEAVALVLYMIIESLLPQDSDAAADLEATDAAEPTPDRDQTAPTDTSTKPPRRESTRTSASASPSRDASASKAVAARDDDEPRAGSSPTAPISVAAGAFLRTLLLDGSRPLVGAALSAELHGQSEFGVALLAAAHAPTEFSFDAADFDLALYSSRLSPRAPLWVGPRVVALLELGAGVDWFRTRLERAPPDATGASSTSSLSYVVSAAVITRIRLTRTLLLSGAVGVDLDVLPQRFVVEADEQRSPALEPARLRPWLLVGLALSPSQSSRLQSTAPAFPAKGAP